MRNQADKQREEENLPVADDSGANEKVKMNATSYWNCKFNQGARYLNEQEINVQFFYCIFYVFYLV